MNPSTWCSEGWFYGRMWKDSSKPHSSPGESDIVFFAPARSRAPNSLRLMLGCLAHTYLEDKYPHFKSEHFPSFSFSFYFLVNFYPFVGEEIKPPKISNWKHWLR